MNSSSESLNKFVKQFFAVKTKRDVQELIDKHNKYFLKEEEARQRLINHIEISMAAMDKSIGLLTNLVYCCEFLVKFITTNKFSDSDNIREKLTEFLISSFKEIYECLHSSQYVERD
jgi:hypothetical protein